MKYKIAPSEPIEEMIQAGCLSQSTEKYDSYTEWAESHSNAMVDKIRNYIIADYKTMLASCPDVESEPICYASSLPIETPTGLVFPVRKEKDLAHYIPVFSQPQPTKVAELEAKLKVAVNLLTVCKIEFSNAPYHAESNGDFKDADTARELLAEINEALKQIGEVE